MHNVHAFAALGWIIMKGNPNKYPKSFGVGHLMETKCNSVASIWIFHHLAHTVVVPILEPLH